MKPFRAAVKGLYSLYSMLSSEIAWCTAVLVAVRVAPVGSREGPDLIPQNWSVR